MTPYTIETYENRHDWLVARKRGLGGSDAPAVLGLSRFRGGYSVATDKLTEAVDEGPLDEIAEWGLRSESMISAKFAEVMESRKWK